MRNWLEALPETQKSSDCGKFSYVELITLNLILTFLSQTALNYFRKSG